MNASLAKFTRLLFMMCFVALFWSTHVWGYSAQESHENIKHGLQEKIYVTPEQIEVTEEGILFYDVVKEILILSKTLSYDEKGLYLKPVVQRGPCGLHSVWCRDCGGCGVIYCPMKCTCPNGVGG